MSINYIYLFSLIHLYFKLISVLSIKRKDNSERMVIHTCSAYEE